MKYDNDVCNKFVEDMKAEGFKPYHYEGRYGTTFPAVEAELDDFDYLRGITDVVLQFDRSDINKDNIVVFPGTSGKLIEDV